MPGVSCGQNTPIVKSGLILCTGKTPRWRTLRWKAWDAKCSCGNGRRANLVTPKQDFRVLVRVFDLLNFENEGKIRQ